MSNQQSLFLKIFGTIATALVIASIVGLIGMYYTSGIISEKTLQNEKAINQLRQYHKEDVQLIRQNITEIKTDQTIIKNDIKQILKELK